MSGQHAHLPNGFGITTGNLEVSALAAHVHETPEGKAALVIDFTLPSGRVQVTLSEPSLVQHLAEQAVLAIPRVGSPW